MGASGSLPWGNSVPPDNTMIGNRTAGVTVNESTALQIDAVWGSIRVIAGGNSTLPVHEYVGDGSVNDKRAPAASESVLTQDPFSEIDLIDFIGQFTTSLALRGNFYGQIVSRDLNFYASQIMPVHPDHAKVRRITSGPNKGRLEYRLNGSIVPTADVVHVRNMSLPGHIEGLNPIQHCRTFGLARAQDGYGEAFFANSALPSGVIEVEEDLDDTEILSMADRWAEAHQGISKAQLPAILSGGAKFSPISVNPEDAQFLESRQYSAGVISGMIFGVPPHMIGIVDRTTSWGVGIEQQEMGFVRTVLLNYVQRYERMISKLLPPGRYVRLDLSERLRGDTLQRFQAWALALGAGWLNKDEVRGIEHYPPIPNGLGKKFYEPVTMTPLSQMGVGGPVTGAGPGGMPLMPNPMAPDSGAQTAPSGQ